MVRNYGILAAALLMCMACGVNGETANAVQSPRCKTPPAATQKIEKIIASCQEDIKLAILKEALNILGETTKEAIKNPKNSKRSKRETFNEDEQRIAGCLLQCVYKKAKAVDEHGFPTVEGLIKLYAEGITERGYFLATAQAVQQCLFLGLRHRLAAPESDKSEDVKGQMCDTAYKVFDCVSDQLATYCSGS